VGDLFALGVIMFQLIYGELPFGGRKVDRGKSAIAVAGMIQSQKPGEKSTTVQTVEVANPNPNPNPNPDYEDGRGCGRVREFHMAVQS